MKSNTLSGKFNFTQLCSFAWPTVVMMVFMSLYTMIDGVFVSRLVGTDALSALNIFTPAVAFYWAVGVMMATGASAIVAKKLGEGETREADENFSFMLVAAIFAGAVVAAAGLAFSDPLLKLLGAEGRVLGYCRDYAVTLLPFVPLAVMQMMFQSFFVVAGRPGFGLTVVVAGGLANIALDYLFMAVMGMGVGGAALATGLGYSIPAVSGVLFFLLRRNGLRLVRPRFDGRVLLHSCGNGASEMVTNLSVAVVTYLFNLNMMRLLGVEGVAAVTIVLYAEYLLCSVYLGFSAGIAPLFSYKYGRGDVKQLRSLFRNSLIFITVCAAMAMGVALTQAGGIVSVFTPESSPVHAYALHGFRIHSLCFLFMGFNIFASALFTAFSDGKTSAFLSFLRTFAFLVTALIVLPRIWGVNGVWLAVPLSEGLTMIATVACLGRFRTVYQYA